MKVQILQIIIFKVTLRTILAIFPQVWDHITQTVFSKYFFLFSILNSRMSKNMCIWHHKLCYSKTGVSPIFTWSNEPWYMYRYLWACPSKHPDLAASTALFWGLAKTVPKWAKLCISMQTRVQCPSLVCWKKIVMVTSSLPSHLFMHFRWIGP